jgi:hypothetical protein
MCVNVQQNRQLENIFLPQQLSKTVYKVRKTTCLRKDFNILSGAFLLFVIATARNEAGSNLGEFPNHDFSKMLRMSKMLFNLDNPEKS